jgi:site-specific DNA-methyltransferase (adenine-specific)
LKQSSKEFDLVLDPFAGSASVLRVCKKLKRKAIGFELNENHFKLASKALQGELEDAQAG